MKNRIALPLATGAVLALAVSACGSDAGEDDGDARSQSSADASATESEDPTGDATDSDQPADPEPTGSVPAYFVAESPSGERLAREFAPSVAEGLDGGVERLAGEPSDPDYTNPAAGWVLSATLGDGEIVATVSGSAPESGDLDLAVQQVVYTLQAAAGETVPVRFVTEAGDPADLGTTNPAVAGDPLDILLLVNISDPGEGTTVGDELLASGRASSFENNVLWEVRSGDAVVLDGYVTADGDYTSGLAEWETTVDLSSLDAGTYTFVALTSDPSEGEGSGPSQDTRTIVVE